LTEQQIKTKRVIGIITDLCEEHGHYSAIFPCSPHNLLVVEGECSVLPLDSQIFITEGAGIVTEISEDGHILRVFCPSVDPYKNSATSLLEASDWIKSVRRVVGYGAGYEDLDLDNFGIEQQFCFKFFQ
jgi:hypothetical protein